jgi:hypothetical protein
MSFDLRFPSTEWPHNRVRVADIRRIVVPGLTAKALASNRQLPAASDSDAIYVSLGDALAVGAQPIGGPDSGTAADEAGYQQQIGGTVDPVGVVDAVESDLISSTNRHTNRDRVDQPRADLRARRCSTPAPTDSTSAA